MRYEFRDHDAERIFDIKEIDTQEPEICISGLVLKGVKKPHDCPAFGKQCTPEHPLGATMVSAEGACAAYYAYGRHLEKTEACGRCTMTTAVENKIDKLNESFRDKILRKCGESVEMKEKFFEKYADHIERLSQRHGQTFR